MKKKRPNIFVLIVPFNYSWTLRTLFFWPYALHITCVYAVCSLAGTLKPVWSDCDLFNNIQSRKKLKFLAYQNYSAF